MDTVALALPLVNVPYVSLVKTAVLPTSASPKRITLCVVLLTILCAGPDTLYLFDTTEFVFSRIVGRLPSNDFLRADKSEYLDRLLDRMMECLELFRLLPPSKIGV